MFSTGRRSSDASTHHQSLTASLAQANDTLAQANDALARPLSSVPLNDDSQHKMNQSKSNNELIFTKKSSSFTFR